MLPPQGSRTSVTPHTIAAAREGHVIIHSGHFSDTWDLSSLRVEGFGVVLKSKGALAEARTHSGSIRHVECTVQPWEGL